MTQSSQKITRALLSVSDKTGLIDFAKGLAKHKIQILSTGGTAKVLKEAGIALTDVSSHTGFPEIMDGRVKTLHPNIHGGILADRENEKHIMAMESHDISKIDLVVVNLYPFVKTVESGANFSECIENIDIGGPSMVRSCAKNHKYTTIITNPEQYDLVLEELQQNLGSTTFETRQKLALKAFEHTAQYDSNISNWMSKQLEEEFPETLFQSASLKQVLRYGENPHQKSALYTTNDQNPSMVNGTQLQGKELSFNNLNDGDAAFEIVCEYKQPSCAIIKHANPCGIASGADTLEAWEKALACDPLSAFGGIVAFNAEIDEALAQKLSDMFLEVIIAPKISEAAKFIFMAKPNLRVIETHAVANPRINAKVVKYLNNGLLVQDRDSKMVSREDCTVVTKRQPTETEWADMLFGWKAIKYVKSNAIIYARDGQTVGIGAGQMSRIDSANIARDKGNLYLKVKDSIVASDAFFPFRDGLQVCADAGATAIIQPGGSVKDKDVIALADELGLAMVFTNMRHFRH